MEEKVAVVVTSIAEPNEVLQQLARGCRKHGYELIIVGDEASPTTFSLEGCRFYGLEEQRKLGLKLAELSPTGHYVRKNIGYLVAIRDGATVILETDDDNVPYDEFWLGRRRRQTVRTISRVGWVNVYRYFSDMKIWPRGLPLERINEPAPNFDDLAMQDVDCPIQQALSDSDPDVDAIYRLTLPLPITFRRNRRVALKNGSWCPFNSQNTSWWADAFPLLYLPNCRFRMTDVWRSFVAQRIAWTNGWSILFQEPTGEQRRNEHDLMRDFEDELPGYLHNSAICQTLGNLQLASGTQHLGDNLRACYESLVKIGVLNSQELVLLDAWIEDIATLRKDFFLKTGAGSSA